MEGLQKNIVGVNETFQIVAQVKTGTSLQYTFSVSRLDDYGGREILFIQKSAQKTFEFQTNVTGKVIF